MINKILKYYRKNYWSDEKYARYIGVKIGKDCLISTKKFSSEPYLVEIGNYCRIANNVGFYTHGGLWSQRKKHKGLDYFGKVKVGDYTYIGDGAKILAGVTVGNDVIIGAGSVVTKSIPNGKIAAGNPARIVGDTVDFVNKTKLFNLNSKGLNYDEKKAFLLSLNDDKFIQK